MDSVRSPHENMSLDACWFELFRSFGFKVRFHGYDFSLPISYYRFRKLDTLRSISQRRFRFLVVFLVISLLRNWKYEIELKCGDLRPDTATRVLQFDFTCADFSYSTS